MLIFCRIFQLVKEPCIWVHLEILESEILASKILARKFSKTENLAVGNSRDREFSQTEILANGFSRGRNFRTQKISWSEILAIKSSRIWKLSPMDFLATEMFVLRIWYNPGFDIWIFLWLSIGQPRIRIWLSLRILGCPKI